MSGRGPLDVVLMYAFDCTTSSPDWYKMDDGIFWLIHEKLKHFPESCLGYIYVMSTPNTYSYDMKQVDSAETKETGYEASGVRSRNTCMKNMASGLPLAHKLMRDHVNGIILLFSDGLCNRGDFFDGAEAFISKVPVHTFSLAWDSYDHGLHTIAENSLGGTFSPLPIPESPSLSVGFSQVLDSILNGTKKPSNNSGRCPLDVVLVYAFERTTESPDWDMTDDIFWLVQGKLKHFPDSCLGYVRSTHNIYTSDMKHVDSTETKATGYNRSGVWNRNPCMMNMACGLPVAHKLMRDHGHLNGIIFLFTDGLRNRGDFYNGAQNFISKVPVHTFTLGWDTNDQDLRAIAENSPGGTFSPIPIPYRPSLSVPFSQVLDYILKGKKNPSNNSGRCPLDVVIVYAFDCTTASPARDKMDNEIFWLVQEKLKLFTDSFLGYVYVMSELNTYISDMKQVDSTETKTNGYKRSSVWSSTTCTTNMAFGLPVAHELMRDHGHLDGIILLFSHGVGNCGDFFDGGEDFVSKVPVYTFTLGGDANNHVLRDMAVNSPGGRFNPIPVPDKPLLSIPFSQMLDDILIQKSNNIDDFNGDDPKPLKEKEPFTQQGKNPHHLPLQHLKDITNNFSRERILGRGGFGVVYRGVLPDGEMIAVKKFVQAKPSSEKQFENEVNLLMKLRHTNVVQLVGYCYETKRLYTPHEGRSVFAWNTESLLCLECVANGSLDKYISDASSGLGWQTRRQIIDGISNGLQYLHEQTEPIIHLDLKPANILLDENMCPKITDFGQSRLFDQTQTIYTAITCGTLGYMPPEFYRGIITPMSDIFSLGVIIMEVITGHRDYPYDIINDSKAFIECELKKWGNRLEKEGENTPVDMYCQQIEQCIDIALICVNPERIKRPTMKKVFDMFRGSGITKCYISKELALSSSSAE